MNIQIEHVPFARFGSYLTFSVLPPEWGYEGLVWRTMHKADSHEVFRMQMTREGHSVPYSMSATPTLCTLEAREGDGRIELCLPETDVVRIRATGGVGLRLESVPPGKGHYAFPLGEGLVNFNCPANRVQYRVFALHGDLEMDMPVHIGDHQRGKGKKRKKLDEPGIVASFLPAEDGTMELCAQEYMMTPGDVESLGRSFEECHEMARKHWLGWLNTGPEMAEDYREGAAHAMHVNYASTVGPWGNFRRNTMLMSRNWMTNCWSWDHCFNAIACSYGNPDVGWDQLNVHFDLQEPGGCLPDGVSAETMGWNFCKPPIHGWALQRMVEANPAVLNEERAANFYPRLVRWTNWWLNHRDSDGDGLPEYRHGNDSGWDNATVFDKGFPVCGADLQAFLVLQMDALATLAHRLGHHEQSAEWNQKADRHMELMIEKLWDGDQFHCKKADTYDYVQEGDCLLNHMPIVLGERLPEQMREKIAEALEPGGRFLTEYGPATESPQSSRYLESGYWRGPIWGPETVLLTDGLRRAGYTDQAAEIARRYCRMCLKTMTFAENYDPLTGEPLCDKAYTWGSSAYLILATQFLR